MSAAKRKSILVSFYKSIVGTLFPAQESTTSSQGTSCLLHCEALPFKIVSVI